MKRLLVAFGDSWTFGSELDLPRQQPWPTHLGQRLDAEVINLGTPASSIEHCLVQLFNYVKISDQYQDYKKIFMVGLTGTTRFLSYSNQLKEFVNITPEANYRTGNIHPSGRPPDVVREFDSLSQHWYGLVECAEYNKYVCTKTAFAFANYCKLNQIDLMLFSYFDPAVFDEALVDKNLFYPLTMTEAMTGQPYNLSITMEHPCFEGKLFHPNVIGHQRMAEILHNHYVQTSN